MATGRSILAVMCLLTSSVVAQMVHRVPFASLGNVVELSIRNASPASAGSMTVRVKETPPYLSFSPPACTAENVPPHSSARAEFTFSVLPSAPIGQTAKVRFVVVDAFGAEWTKEVAVVVDPPRSFQLLDACPNPFNPATTVSFDLPEPARVELRAYDLLGRKVALVAEGNLAPGRHQRIWNASGLATGAYILVFEARQEGGATVRLGRRVVLAK